MQFEIKIYPTLTYKANRGVFTTFIHVFVNGKDVADFETFDQLQSWVVLGADFRLSDCKPAESPRAETSVQEEAKLVSHYIMTYNALQAIIEIGKRDLSNPKYNSYFQEAERVLLKPDVALRTWYDRVAAQEIAIRNLQTQHEVLQAKYDQMEESYQKVIRQKDALYQGMARISDGADTLKVAVKIAEQTLSTFEAEQ